MEVYEYGAWFRTDGGVVFRHILDVGFYWAGVDTRIAMGYLVVVGYCRFG